MIGALGGALLRGAGGALAKGAARGAGKKLIGGRNKKKNQIIKRPTQGQEQGGSGALVVRPKTALIPASDIPARRTTVQPKTTAGVSGKSTLEKIDKEVLEIRKLLGKSIKEEGKDVKNKKKLFEKERRENKERKLEKRPDGSGIMGGLSKISPGGGGILGAISNFIFSVLAGKFLIFLLNNYETVTNIVKGLAAATGFIIDLGGKILDGMIGLVDGVYSVTDAIGEEIKGVGGEEAGKEYNKFLGTFNRFINLAMILAMAGVPGNIGGGNIPGGGKVPKTLKLPGGKPIQTSKFAGFNQAGKFGTGTNKSAEYMNRGRAAKLIERKYGNEAARAYQNSYDNAVKSGKSPTQAAQKAKANINKLFKKGQIIPKPAGKGLGATGGARASGRFGGVFRRGLGKAGSRLQTRIMGRGARLATRRMGAAASKFASKIKIPIIGPLIVGINTYMETGKLDRALFSAGGAALGGLLGNLIPIPILGSIIGTLAGEYVGDIFYELIRGGGVAAVGAKLKRDIKKVIDGVTIFKDWMVKGIGNIQKNKEHSISFDKPWWFGGGKWDAQKALEQMVGFEMGAWPTLLNPLELNLIKKFDILRKAFFSESVKSGSQNINRVDHATRPDNNNNDRRGFSDQDDPNSPGGNRPRSITRGSGRRSLPSGSGNITKVSFDDPNFDPGTTRKKDTQIYLHWTAGNYGDASASYGYHTIFTGDGGIVRNKSYDARGGHTEGKNSNSVGLSLAAMNGASPTNFGSQPVTQEQLNQMAAEAARLAVKWGWSESDIDKNVWTHAEAGSGLDPRGLNGHLDYNGDGKPDNYGMFGRAPNEPMYRWDLYTVTEDGEPGSGGPILRDMIKKHFRNFKAELSGKDPDEQNNPRGDSDQDGPEKNSPAGSDKNKSTRKASSLEGFLNKAENRSGGSGATYNITGIGNYKLGRDIFGIPVDKLFLYDGAPETGPGERYHGKNVIEGKTRIRSYLERVRPKLFSGLKIDPDTGRTRVDADGNPVVIDPRTGKPLTGTDAIEPEQDDASKRPPAILCYGTNDFSLPENVIKDRANSIMTELINQGYFVVVIPPSPKLYINAVGKDCPAPYKGVYAAANHKSYSMNLPEGKKPITIEFGAYEPTDKLGKFVHLKPEFAKKMFNKYKGAIFVGDSNAVRIKGAISGDYTDTKLAVVGAGGDKILAQARKAGPPSPDAVVDQRAARDPIAPPPPSNDVAPSGGDDEPKVALEGVDFSSLKGGGAFSDMFAEARANLGTKPPNFTPIPRSSIVPKRQSSSSSSSSASSSSNNFVAPQSSKTIVVPDQLNKDVALRNQTDYEEEGQKVIIVNQPYIVNNSGGQQPQTYTSSIYYS